MSYPTPATPLPWLQGKIGDVGYSDTVAPCHIWTAKGAGYGIVATTAPWSQPYDHQPKDAAYIVRAANAFPHLVAALEATLLILTKAPGHRDMIAHALAIARGEVTP